MKIKVHIPQNMAYSMMAGTPAINGLYVAFFTLLLYVIFGVYFKNLN